LNHVTEIILRTCIEKVSLSKEQADNYIDQKLEQGILLYYYKCQFCSRYHVSKQDESFKYLEVIGGNSE
jgi:hypothetical protein